MKERFDLPQSATDAAQIMAMSAAGNSSLNDQLPLATASDCVNSQRIPTRSEECNALPSDRFTDDIMPTDSISNACSKKSSKRSSSSGSRSSRSSTTSARLQAEAEVAALLVHQQMLQQKHEVEEEEERLSRKKEQIDLQTKIAVSMAKVNVYKAAVSEPSEHLKVTDSRKKSDKMKPSNVIPAASFQVNAPVESLPVSISTRDLPFKLRDKWRAVAFELQEERNAQAVFKDIVYFVEKQNTFKSQGTRLIPDDPAEQALVYQRMFETENLLKKMYDVAFYEMFVPEGERMESALKRNKENLIAELKLWEGYLEKTGKGSFLAGKNFSMADVVAFPIVAYFPRFHCPKERCPRLMEYYEMLKDRPSIKASWPPHWLEKPEGQDTLKNL
ncbi:hypothetical protein QQF64_012855 [Cirrhinus molitorella]|uniref:GST C-terminal domain-containing protein n=1 Tax=Cirrhinus molitorella TaxID=172907 RepID=A0ABR3LPG3_9TELE